MKVFHRIVLTRVLLDEKVVLWLVTVNKAGPSGRAVEGVGLRPLAC